MSFSVETKEKTGPCGEMIHHKAPDMEKEQRDTEYVIKWLLEKTKPYLFNLNRLKTTNKAYQLKGIDLIGYTDIGTIKIENKIRDHFYMKEMDILIETLSNEQRLTPGWIEYSVSDFLAYVYNLNGSIVGHVLDLPKLKKWWKNENKEEYEIKYSPNEGYRTKNRAVPISKIPSEIWIYSDIISIENNFSLSHYLRK